MDIQNMIEKYGPEITKTLKIASTQLYNKVLWYVQADGVVQLLTYLLVSISYVIATVLGVRWIKKNWKLFEDDYSKGGSPIELSIMLAFIFYMLFPLFISSLVSNISKIVTPEYWIINQIINKAK